jgi:hypothetical protein
MDLSDKTNAISPNKYGPTLREIGGDIVTALVNLVLL